MKVTKVSKVFACLVAAVHLRPTTSTAKRLMGKRKFADAYDLGVDDPKQFRLRAFPVNMCEPIKVN